MSKSNFFIFEEEKEQDMTNGRMTITEVADKIGVTSKTIMRWEASGKVKKAKRDWRGWRFYTRDDMLGLKKFKESIFYAENEEGTRNVN